MGTRLWRVGTDVGLGGVALPTGGPWASSSLRKDSFLGGGFGRWPWIPTCAKFTLSNTLANYEGVTLSVSAGSVANYMFEFDQAGDGVGGGNDPINISTFATATEVAEAIQVALIAAGFTDLRCFFRAADATPDQPMVIASRLEDESRTFNIVASSGAIFSSPLTILKRVAPHYVPVLNANRAYLTPADVDGSTVRAFPIYHGRMWGGRRGAEVSTGMSTLDLLAPLG